MRSTNERTVLKNLIVTCRDAARGFEWAADHTHDPQLRALFSKVATERHQYVMELLPHAWWLGGLPEEDGSRIAALHRAWMAVKDRLAFHQDHALLVEAERGERAALNAYDEAITGTLPPEIRDVLKTQHLGVQTTYERLQTAAETA